MLAGLRQTTGSSSTACCGCCVGARWHDLPERYGKYKSVHKRFMRWAQSGVWERIFEDLIRDKKNLYLMIDSTIVRAHQQAATGRKKGLRGQGSGAFPSWTDDQNPPAHRRKWPAGLLPALCPTGQRLYRSPQTCWGAQGLNSRWST